MVTDEQLEAYRAESKAMALDARRKWRSGRMIEALESAGTDGLTRSELLRKSKSSATEFDLMLASLRSAGRVSIEMTVSGGRPLMTIRAVQG